MTAGHGCREGGWATGAVGSPRVEEELATPFYEGLFCILQDSVQFAWTVTRRTAASRVGHRHTFGTKNLFGRRAARKAPSWRLLATCTAKRWVHVENVCPLAAVSCQRIRQEKAGGREFVTAFSLLLSHRGCTMAVIGFLWRTSPHDSTPTKGTVGSLAIPSAPPPAFCTLNFAPAILEASPCRVKALAGHSS